ncbi:class I SAM-dependent methyltransferase [Alkalisalibacterium limincola]|nr:class I SAM-dependent methyltransferase [Alkalisalibacterium limincola]
MNPLRRLRSGLRLLQPRQLRVRGGTCPFCGPTFLVRLRAEETGVRCLRCAASAVHLSMGWALRPFAGTIPRSDAYELSSRGPLVEWLRRHSRSLQVSEYFDDVPAGQLRDGVRCEDVQALGLPDASFDLVTHTEVFEHVPDDRRGFAELFRVLRPGGVMVFTVPLTASPGTIERARIAGGELEHLLPPTYHTDLLRGEGRVLCFRDYGLDVVERVAQAGFGQVRLLEPDPRVPWGYGRRVVTAIKERP